ncbi:MAG: glycosyltransferase family 4 protein [Candidatus Omnitrophica bacterium]|nr:glycosyltransferase family 4 protein [Candidatus Omnitrophota bacterium]
MKHRIGIDLRMLHHAGIGTYIREVVTSFVDSGIAKEIDLSLFGEPARHFESSGLPRYPFYSRIYTVEEQFEYPFRLPHVRLWHAPHYNVPIFKGRTKLVVTIHDLVHWIFRHEFFNSLQAFYARQMFRQALKSADHIITVSNQTCDDLLEYFDTDPERITVIYEGVGDQFRELEPEKVAAVRAKYHLPESFFFYVGSIKPYKNVLLLIHLFRRLRQEGKINSALVLVGKQDRKYPHAFKELSRLEGDPAIIHLDRVDHQDLIAMYNAALCLVHPSLYEGFGLTLLEAMACGTPVIASRTSSIPEVVGDAAWLIDPWSQRELSDAIVRIETCPGLREDLKRRGKIRAARYFWKETAVRTAEVYEKVLSKP